ncbi:MAG: GC-type dockerin domain-anchored protein [bacterium]
MSSPLLRITLSPARPLGAVLLALVLMLLLTNPAPARAECGPGWVETGSPFNVGNVSAVAALPNGDIIVGGDLQYINDQGQSDVTTTYRYYQSTSQWSRIDSGFTGTDRTVNNLAVLPGGDVIAGGFFNSIGGIPANNIARYNPATNTWSAIGSGVSGATFGLVSALTVLPDGRVAVGGSFTTAGGVPANNVAIYDPATNTWSALGSGVNGEVFALAFNPATSDAYVGGNFYSASGVFVRNVARYNLDTDTWSPLASGSEPGFEFGTNSVINALAVLPGGDVIAGGQFTSAGGVPVNKIARFNWATLTWSALGSGVTEENFATVSSLATLPTGNVLVGGAFTTAGGAPANNIALYNPATSTWSTLGSGTNFFVTSLASLPGGDVLLGGGFSFAGGLFSPRVARYSFTGPTVSITTGPADFEACEPNTTATFSVTTVSTGNAPVTYQWRKDGIPVSELSNPTASTPTLTIEFVSFNDEGTYDCVVSNGCTTITSTPARLFLCGCGPRWVPMEPPTTMRGVANDSAVLPDGDLVLGGFFTTTTDWLTNRLARYNPTTNTLSQLGSDGFSNSSSINAVAVLPGGDVIVGGTFTAAGGVPANNIVRYSPATNTWTALGSGLNARPLDLLVIPGGDVIATGDFTTAGGVPANYIARYNPATDTWSALGSGLSFIGICLALAPGGDVIVGGIFGTAGGVNVNNIARYNPVANTWSDIGFGVVYQVNSVAILPGGDVIAGSYPGINDPTMQRILRYNASSNTWSPLGSGLQGVEIEVTSLAVLPGGDLIAGGNFTTVGGITANSIARYNPASDSWSALGSGLGSTFRFTPYVRAVAALPGGDVLASGSFDLAGGVPAELIARYRPLGTPAPVITAQPMPQTTTCPTRSATFTIGLTAQGSVSYQWQWRTDPANEWNTVNDGLNLDQYGSSSRFTAQGASSSVLSITGASGSGTAGSHWEKRCVVLNDCHLVVSNATTLTARTCGCGLSDIAGPGQSVGSDNTLTADDIIVFLNWFFAGNTGGDVAGAGQSTVPDGQFTADDIIVFLNRFFAGC